MKLQSRSFLCFPECTSSQLLFHFVSRKKKQNWRRTLTNTLDVPGLHPMRTDRASFLQDKSCKRIHSGAFAKTLKYLLKLIRNVFWGWEYSCGSTIFFSLIPVGLNLHLYFREIFQTFQFVLSAVLVLDCKLTQLNSKWSMDNIIGLKFISCTPNLPKPFGSIQSQRVTLFTRIFDLLSPSFFPLGN